MDINGLIVGTRTRNMRKLVDALQHAIDGTGPSLATGAREEALRLIESAFQYAGPLSPWIMDLIDAQQRAALSAAASLARHDTGDRAGHILNPFGIGKLRRAYWCYVRPNPRKAIDQWNAADQRRNRILGLGLGEELSHCCRPPIDPEELKKWQEAAARLRSLEARENQIADRLARIKENREARHRADPSHHRRDASPDQ